MSMIGVDNSYVAARRNLVRALLMLRSYGPEAIVVVGAQAVYLQCQADDLPFAPFTNDSDFAVDPRVLDEIPPIRRVLEDGGYRLIGDQPGLYGATEADGKFIVGSAVDILVPEEFAIGNGRRDARLPGNNERAARRTAGLEASLYDKDLRRVAAFDEAASNIEAFVAGPAALIIAKSVKISERTDDRLKGKDAGDVFRLLRAYELTSLKRRFAALRQVSEISTAVTHGIEKVREIFVDGRKGRSLFATLLDSRDRTELLASYDVLVEELGQAIE